MPARENRIQKNIRLTPTANEIMKRLAALEAASEGRIIERLLRREARREGWTDFGDLPSLRGRQV
jgi:hypothetical protein